MNCPNCGARMMDGSDMCVRCGHRIGGGNVRNNTYRVNGQVLDASHTILDSKEIGRRRINLLGPIFMVALLAGVVYLVITYFPVNDFLNFFNQTSDGIAESIASKTLTAAKEFYTNTLWENGGQNLFGNEYDVAILSEKKYIVGSAPESGKFVIIDDTEYGIELRDVVIKGYICNGTTQSLKCEKIEENETTVPES